MKEGLSIKDGLVIPEHELEITTSRAGGPGGQHVNKTNTRITVRWNVRSTAALMPEQKERVERVLRSQLTSDGDLMVHNSESRSQAHNKRAALLDLAQKIRKALHVPKKRMKTKIPRGVQEARLKEKRTRSDIKKKRRVSYDE